MIVVVVNRRGKRKQQQPQLQRQDSSGVSVSCAVGGLHDGTGISPTKIKFAMVTVMVGCTEHSICFACRSLLPPGLPSHDFSPYSPPPSQVPQL